MKENETTIVVFDSFCKLVGSVRFRRLTKLKYAVKAAMLSQVIVRVAIQPSR